MQPVVPIKDIVICRLRRSAGSESHRRWLVLVVVVALWAPAAGIACPSPRELIMAATEQLVQDLQANRNAIENDPLLARRIAEKNAIPLIDFPRIARGVLGKHWGSATAQQRRRFTQAFRSFLESVYVAAMVAFADEIISHARNIDYPPLQLRDGGRKALVRTVINLTRGLKVKVDYKMHRIGDHWRVYDVSVLGISLAAIYRNTFALQIRRHGLDRLINELEVRALSGTASVPTLR